MLKIIVNIIFAPIIFAIMYAPFGLIAYGMYTVLNNYVNSETAIVAFTVYVVYILTRTIHRIYNQLSEKLDEL